MAVTYAPLKPAIHYPDSDGLPMAESDFQRGPLTYAVEALSIHFADRPDVYVSGNLFIYYKEGDPEAVVAPDTFVVFGAPKRRPNSYRLWQEGKAPDFVIEITSEATHAKDQGPKRGTYAFLGVREYFQYDPTGDYLVPQLQGLRLSGMNYHPMPAQTLPDGTLALHSEVLALELRLIDGELRFFDPASGRKLMSHAEAEAARREAEEATFREAAARREAEEATFREAAARREAEAEVERLRAELARLRGGRDE
jgi:Uma2 family endonuclease